MCKKIVNLFLHIFSTAAIFGFAITSLYLFSTEGPTATDNKQETIKVVTFLNKVNNKKLTTPPPPKAPNCNENSTTITDDHTFDKCIASICGNANNIDNYQEYMEKTIDTTAALLSNIPIDFKKPYIEYMNKEIKYRQDQLNNLIAAFNEKIFSIDPKFIPINNLIIAVTFISMIKKEYDKNFLLTFSRFDEQKLENLSYTLTPVEQNRIIQILNNSKIIQQMLSIDINPEGWIKSRHPGKNITDAIKTEAKLLRSRYLKLKVKNESIFKFIKEIPTVPILDKRHLVNRVIQGYKLTKDEFLDFFTDSYINNVVFNIIEFPHKYQYLSNNNLISIIEKINPKKLAKEQLKKLSDESILTERRKDVLEMCYTSYLLKAALPTEIENTIFEIETYSYKKLFRNILPNCSNYSRGKLKGLVKNIKFILPKTEKEFILFFKQKSDQFFLNEKINIDSFYEIDDPAILKMQGITTSYDFLTTPDAPPFKSLQKFCTRHGISPVSIDYTQALSGEIVTSWQTVPLPYGKQTIFHEYGHNIYNSFAKGKLSKNSFLDFKKSISCLQTMHTEKGYCKGVKPLQAKSMDEKRSTLIDIDYTECIYTEEDFSDLFIPPPASNSMSKNLFCYYLYQYDGEYLPATVENKYKHDPHSSDFFRLLHTEFRRAGKLSDSCTNYLKSTGETFPLKDCKFPQVNTTLQKNH